MSTDPIDPTELLARMKTLETRMEGFFAGMQRHISRSVDATYAQVEALIGLYREIDGLAALPPMRRWAISPDAARELRNLVVAHRPALTLELGSGISTILIAMELQRLGSGSIVAFEHDPLYWAETRDRIEAHGLGDVASVRLAPLVPHEIDGTTYRWYDIDVATLPGPVELVVVDGPPETTGPGARFPALPVLRSVSADRCLFFLDDYVRPDEQAMVQRWITRHGAELRGFSSIAEKWTATLGFAPGDGTAANGVTEMGAAQESRGS
jgi:hypothetical protein